VITACRVRLRPILMTSLATIIGMIPMAMKLGTGAEQYAPMAKAIIGGLTVVCAPDDFYRAGGVLTGVCKRGAKERERRRHWSLHNEARDSASGDLAEKRRTRRLMRRFRGNPMTRAKVFLFCHVALFVWAILPRPGWAQGADRSGSARTYPPPRSRKPRRLGLTWLGSRRHRRCWLRVFRAGCDRRRYPLLVRKCSRRGKRTVKRHAFDRVQAEQWRSRTIRGSAWDGCWRWHNIRFTGETRAAELPKFYGAMTAVDAK